MIEFIERCSAPDFLAPGTGERIEVRGRSLEQRCHRVSALTPPSPTGKGISHQALFILR